MAEDRIDKRWWREPEADVHQAVYAVVSLLRDQQSAREAMNLRHARLYGNLPILGLNASLYSQVETNTRKFPRLALNIVKSCCNSVTAKIAKSKPRPMFLTSDGDWSQKRRAKGLTKFVEGAFYEGQLYKLAPRIFLDATVFGTGIMRVCEERGRIRYERILPDELLVDDAEAVYGEPRSYYLTRFVDRAVLRELYPDQADAIDDANPAQKPYWSQDVYADLVTVYESWHLPSGPEAKDGRHVIVIENATLLDEPFTDDSPPFVFLRWNDRLIGFWGAGLAEELTGIQLEINKTLLKISTILHLLAQPWILVEAGSKVKNSHLTNEIGAIISYTGQPPQVVTHNAVPPELARHLEMLYARAYEITGISQLSAQSQKPAGLNSGVALQTYSDIETERFMIAAREYEEFFLEAARQTIRLVRRVAKNGGYSVRYPGARTLEQIDWADVDIDDDAYVMKCYPTNLLASSPAGRLAQVQEMLAGGLIGPEEAKALLDFPDVERFMSLATAARDDVDMLLEMMIEHGEYQPPEPFMDLQLAIRMTQSAYLRARTDGVPEDRLELLRRFMGDAKALLEKAAPPTTGPMPPVAPPDGGIPMAPDMPPGVSLDMPPQLPPPVEAVA